MRDKDTLDSLLPGQSGIIVSVSNTNHMVRQRLIDMGLTPGTKIKIKKIAPFGDPIEVTVRGYELSLRRSDAAQITMGNPPARTQKVNGNKLIYDSRPHDPEVLRRMRLAHDREKQYRAGIYDNTAHDKREMKIALAGNPNSGKTTLFNVLTGSSQYVGNWPGVTVEKKEGKTRIQNRSVTIVDLPGIYSLSPYSMEEIVARNFIINEAPDAIINIVDATNLERNLYLTIQLLELERPMVLALNFMDEIEKTGDKIDIEKLSIKLGIPVIPITAKTGKNIEDLLYAAHMQMHVGYTFEPDDLYDEFTHEIHHRIHELIHVKAHAAGIPAHWASIKLLEGDGVVEKALDLEDDIKSRIKQIAEEYESLSDLGDRETLIADSRYQYIEEVTCAALQKCRPADELSLSDKIDRILTHRIFALPAFLLAMLIVFAITFGPFGHLLSDSVGTVIDNYFSVWVERALGAIGAPGWLISLCVGGIIAGVGGVLTFLPQIALLFFFLSLLEDSGYMARAAFIMDRLLKRFGLSGKAFIPMLMGFGCSVPAIMGARTMENEKDRRLTIMLIPFMSCSAKLPVYGLISAAFFGKYAGIVVFALYVLGLIMVIVTGLLFKRTIFKGDTAAFVLELPPYRMPSLGNTLQHVWEKIRGFIIKAGTVIFLMSIVLWFLKTFNMNLDMVETASDSILAFLGSIISPIFIPMGFGTWQAAVALLTGVVAKEAVVASLSMFYGFSLNAASSAVAAALGGTFASPLAAFAFLVFVLLYVPCIAAVATIRKEMGSLKWTFASVAWQLIAAYTISLLIYQIGHLIGLG